MQRDTITLALGVLLVGSQVLGYFLGRDVNVTLATLGVTLLGVTPLLRAGDQRKNGSS